MVSEADRSGALLRTQALVLAVTFVSAVAWPMVVPGTKDSFPFSTYPMFSGNRDSIRLVQLVAVDETGNVRPVPKEWLGATELLQAKTLVQRAARRGTKARLRFCRRIASGVSGFKEGSEVRALQLVRVRLRPVRYLASGGNTASRRVLTRCPVPGAS